MLRRKKIYWYMIVLSFFLCSDAFNPGKGIVVGSPPHILSVTVNKDRVTLEADKAPLETVLQELSQKTGIRFIVHPASVSTDLLSISLTNSTFSETLARILKNYSYLMEGGKTPTVTILASKATGEVTAKQPEARIISSQGGGTSTPPSGPTSKAEERVVSVQQPVVRVAEPRPYDLDECQPLEFTEKDAAQAIADLAPVSTSISSGSRDRSGSVEGGQENPLLKEVTEQSRKKLVEAKIKRAQKVLSTERCSNLWPQAIDELSQFQDERVTATLAEVAGTGKADKLRDKAVQALWHNTADSEFKNTKGIEALRKLAQSSDHRVSRIAQDALRDYERYTKKKK